MASSDLQRRCEVGFRALLRNRWLDRLSFVRILELAVAAFIALSKCLRSAFMPIDLTLMKQPGQPAELATAYVILADPLSSYVSGTTIAVTGGVPII
jgi:NAD(P)-dependent dehydrogenase (short-subunit alcohol dehydrogenase family)